ncbi:mandelate racemase/muconate lactonizing enzyme family protein [Shewanella sp. 1_MG-2023]|uniref:mandelate racemase/muconate lactonizing enzyme family protein n=1 Tax=unclassified Shewanella TaxID=196818 RepID=UPI000C857CD3|nr:MULTISPECIES: mandelate racemase/muconate lactonizing enzyme family protein [unclassified Shewanella]MCC4834458.1 mandelate racemase/muconate lactonizing enzyme family protein [Shewanella sp. 10N.7]MDO6613404.1 mandelate racemase/muconate lactonizing enzyme family protein [Shewanella sp. 7_MG-2023]MDO6770070.1 mandelate racemase/muconate lactonizing enzyme family protein [Shewanella sp. 2_MG-2023]MDO6794818.1 mandelate racemase/muconate lactonizing enzyme family protein [Shewanella sp. 1_MG-
MKIIEIKSHVLQYDLEEELGYSQQYYAQRTTHLVEVITDVGITGWGECFGGGGIAFANKTIVEKVIQPMILGMDPLDREVIWHKVYNLMRDHGQKGMPIQSLSGVDIALWDIAGKFHGQPVYKLLGGAFRERIPAYGYGMMLQRFDDLEARFTDESARIKEMGFTATKMKIGLSPDRDIKLVEAVRKGIGNDMRLMVDANHAYTAREAIPLGRELQNLGVHWFEEPVAPEDKQGYRDLCEALDMTIAGGEAEFTRWGFRDLIENRCVDLLQPEVCALGGITEYQKVLAMAHAHFIPVINHVWGSAIAVGTNLHLLAALPDLPGAAHPVQPMLEYDTTPNRFREDLLKEPLNILKQVKDSGGSVALPQGPGIGVEPDPDFIKHYEVIN